MLNHFMFIYVDIYTPLFSPMENKAAYNIMLSSFILPSQQPLGEVG